MGFQLINDAHQLAASVRNTLPDMRVSRITLLSFTMAAPNMPTARRVHLSDSVRNHEELIKVTDHKKLIEFLDSQQKQIHLLEAHVHNLAQAIIAISGSNSNARLQAIPDSPKEEKPALAVSQRWKRRDGEVVTIDRSDTHHPFGATHPFWAEGISYNFDGFSSFSGASTSYDLIELLPPPASGLQWTENKPASEECRYDHCIAETPFGRFLITWKSWKAYDGPTVDETPWGDWYGSFNSVEEAKAACQKGFDKNLEACAALSTQLNSPT